MKNIFLLGAGASTGCKGTNFKVPIGRELFPLLKRQFSNTWSKLPTDLETIFSDNFEAGMQVIWDKYSTNIPVLMKDLAVLFSSAAITNHEENLYCKIFQKTKKKDLTENSIFSTINYDCLLEIAAHLTGLKINYFGKLNKDAVAIWKLHGSCNFISKGISATSDIRFTRGVVFDAGINVIQPNQVREYCHGNNALYPAMSIYMKDKPLQIAAIVRQGDVSFDILI